MRPLEYADRVGTSGAVAIVAVTSDGQLVLTEHTASRSAGG